MWSKILYRTKWVILLVLVTLLTNLSYKVYAQTAIDLTIGTATDGSLSGYGDIRYYKVSVQQGQKVFVLLDKSSSFYTYLSIKEGGLPDRGVGEAPDQAVELTPQAAGFCYIRVELYNSYGSSSSGSYTITAHDENTFPELTIGKILSNQQLKWNGDKQWYQLRLDSVAPLLIHTMKTTQWNGSLNVKNGGLPITQPYFSESGNADLLVTLLNSEAGTYYINVTNNSGSAVSYSLSADTSYSQKEILFNEWQEINLYRNTQRIFKINVPANTGNLFFLVRKSTKIGHHGTWDGRIRIFRGATLLAEESGMLDFDEQFKNAPGGTYYAEIWANDDAAAEIKVCDHLDPLTLGEWHKGVVLKGWGHDWTQADVPAGVDTLFFETQGFGVYSNMNIYYDSLDNTTDHWYFDNWRQGYHLEGKIVKPKSGRYYFKYEDSDNVEGGVSQSRDYLINVDVKPMDEAAPVEPLITDLSTYAVSQELTTINIYGKGFNTKCIVSMIRNGYDDILAQYRIVDSINNNIIANFNLVDAATGEWMIKVEKPSFGSTLSPKPVIIKSESESFLWMNIIGRDEIRSGRPSKYFVSFGNKGNSSIRDCYVIIKFSPGHYFKTDLPKLIEVSEEYLSTDENAIVIPIPLLNPNSKGEFNFLIKSYQTGKIIFDSKIITSASALPQSLSLNKSTNSNTDDKTPYSTYYPPDASPPLGAICYWDLYGVSMHTGIYVGNNEIIELNPIDSSNPLSLLLKCEPFKVSKSDANKRFSEKNYFGAWTWPGYQPTEGALVAERAKNKEGETGTYSLIIDNFPFGGSVKNCNTIIYESAYEFLEKSGINWYSNPETTFYHFISLSPYPEKILSWPTSKFMEYYENIIKIELSLINLFPECINSEGHKEEKNIVSSSTPEDKYGTTGFESPKNSTNVSQRYVSKDDAFTYRIDFWNKETATAPAQEVFIWDTLDTKFDESTLNFTEFSFLRWTTPLKGGQYFNVNVDMRPDMNLIVNAEGKYDPNSREIKWTFRSLDPVSMELTEDPLAGFLPPIDTTGYQIGWVEYKIKPYYNLTTGTTITNQAWVNFDGVGPTNPAPNKAPWLNTIDAIAPVSEVNPAITHLDTTSYRLSWFGEDDEGGSGIITYSIYVSEDGGIYKSLISNTPDTSAIFTIEYDHNYMFYSIARDGAGNIEKAPAVYDASLLVTSIDDKEIVKQENILNLSCRPNPFNNSAEITFSLPENGKVILQLFDIRGILINTLLNTNLTYGSQMYQINNGTLPEGMYFVKLIYTNSDDRITQTIKIIRTDL